MSENLMKNLQNWHKRNPWFNGQSDLSIIAMRINHELINKGYEISTKKFLKELDKRLKYVRDKNNINPKKQSYIVSRDEEGRLIGHRAIEV